jgi:hypothetical protein
MQDSGTAELAVVRWLAALALDHKARKDFDSPTLMANSAEHHSKDGFNVGPRVFATPSAAFLS